MQWHERIGRRLKLRDLHILLAVLEAGAMSKAARRLAISQPAVSKAIADIEYAVGHPLIDRTRKGLEPTAYGRALARRAAIVFDELKQAVDELESLADPTVGELRIGSSEAMAAGLLPAIVDRLSRKYPKILLEVSHFGALASDFAQLRERGVDLLLGRMPQSMPERDLASEVLFDERIHIVAGKDSIWAHRRKIRLSDLVNECWALPPPDSVPAILLAEAFTASGLKPPHASITTASLHLLARGLPATGRFLSVLPASVLRFSADRHAFKVLPIELPADRSPVGLIWVKNRTLTSAARLFIECARELAGSNSVVSAR